MRARVIAQGDDGDGPVAYLVVDDEARRALLVDPGPAIDHLLAVASTEGLELERILLTRPFGEGTAGVARVLDAHPGIAVQAFVDDASAVPGVTGAIAPGDFTGVGELALVATATAPSARQLAYLVRETVDGAPAEVFTGDALLQGAVGLAGGPGEPTVEERRYAVVDVLLALPPETAVRPARGPSTTVEHERRENPFARYWLGDLAASPQPVELTEPGREDATTGATLLVGAVAASGRYGLVELPGGDERIVPGAWLRPV